MEWQARQPRDSKSSLPCAAFPGVCLCESRSGEAGLPDERGDGLHFVIGCRRNCGILVVGRNSWVWPSQYGIHSLCNLHADFF